MQVLVSSQLLRDLSVGRLSESSYIGHWLRLSAKMDEANISDALSRHVRSKKGMDCPLYSMPGALASLRADILDDSVSLLLAATGSPASGSALSMPPIHIARTLVAIGALKHCTDNNGTDKLITALTAGRTSGVWASVAAYLRGPSTTDLATGLLQLYLDIISDKLRCILNRKATTAGDSHSSQAEVLLEAITLVQQTIYTVFVVFMQTSGPVANSLLDRCAQDFSKAVLLRVNEVAGLAVSGSVQSSAVFASAAASPFSLGSSHKQSSAARQQLHEMWTAWMFGGGRNGEDAHGATMAVAAAASLLSSACMACLRAIKSSADVTALQHRVRSACAVIPFSSSSNSRGGGIGAEEVKATWSEANKLLVLKLNNSRLLSTTAEQEISAGSSADLLWSRVFRLPFLRQVRASYCLLVYMYMHIMCIYTMYVLFIRILCVFKYTICIYYMYV